MKLLALCAFFLSARAFTSIGVGNLIPGAELISASDKANLNNIGACHAKHHDRRTVTIRHSRHKNDDISDDFLWGIKKANHGGRLLLKKGHTYVIGKKLDLTFLNDIEVQLDGELKVRLIPSVWIRAEDD